MTEQQIPMLLRLVALITLLQSRQIPTTKQNSNVPAEENENTIKGEMEHQERYINVTFMENNIVLFLL